MSFFSNNSKVNQLSASLAEIAYQVTSYGAKGDWNGTIGTDDTQAINNAIAAIQNLPNATLFFPKSQGYCVSSTITIPVGINVVMDAPIIYTGIDNNPAVVVGSSTINNTGINLKLQTIRKTQSDWSNEGCIGVKIINSYACDISIIQSCNFTIGVQLIGSSKGFSYNEIHFYQLLNNKIGVDCTNENSGWCNENNYYGGRVSNFSNINNNLSRYGIRITSKASYYNNNNVFYKPSFELFVPSAGEAIPVLIEYGTNNNFKDIRNEGNSTTTIRVLNQSSENYVNTGIGDISVDDQSIYPGTSSSSVRKKLIDNVNKLIFNSGSIQKNAGLYNGSTQVFVPKIMFGWSTNGSTNKYAYSGSTINNNYLEVTGGYSLGVYVKTNLCKKFVLRKDCELSYGGRILIRCYDVNGNILTDSGQPYVKTLSDNTASWVSQYGGAYKTGGDSYGDFYFTVTQDVDYIAVMVTPGTNPLRIRSFGIYAENYHPAVWCDYEEIIPGVCLGTTTPTIGTWQKGKRVLNDNITVGQPKAWICSVSGTQGTLNGGATTGSITTGTATLTVNDVTGLLVGQYITITGVTGVKKILSISGTTVTIDSNVNTTVTNAAIAFSPCAWVSEGNL